MATVTKTQIDGWKKEHGEVFVYEVDGMAAYFRKPTRKELSYASIGSNQMKDSIKYSELLMNSCFLGGDREIIDNDAYFLGAAPVIEALSEAKVGEVKKL